MRNAIKTIKLRFLLLLFVLLTTINKAQPIGWTYERDIIISNSNNPNNLYNYQVKFSFDHYTLCLYGKSKTNGSDLRLTDANNNLLNFWIESGLNTYNCIVWVKIPLIPPSSSLKVKLFYGNNSVTSSLSNGNNTFNFFDDFNGSLLDPSKWTTYQEATTPSQNGSVIISNSELTIRSGRSSDLTTTNRIVKSIPTFNGNQRMRLRVKAPTWGGFGSALGGFRAVFWSIGSIGAAQFVADEGGHLARIQDQQSNVYSSPNFSSQYNPINYAVDEIALNYKDNSNMIYKINDNQVWSYQSLPNQNNLIIYLAARNWSPSSSYPEGTIVIDWIFLSEYSSIEPSYTIGNEQNLSVSKIISASCNPLIGGTITGSGSYNLGSSISLTAKPNDGYLFVNWTENGNVVSMNPTYTFIVDNDRILVANFSVIQYMVAASSLPSSGGSTTGTGTYNHATNVTVKATPTNITGSRYQFANWTEDGAVVSNNASYNFTLLKNRTLVANFLDVTSVEKENGIPTTFTLFQNYPNPFNPVTKIQFSLPKESHVRLSVFNSLGQEIATLVDQNMNPGIYSILFDGTFLSSGIYFSKMIANDFVQEKKMILIK